MGNNKYKILIVEDEEKIARFVTLELEHEGYQVEHAADGRTAVDLALERDYDLILLDVLLPQLNGMEVLRRIRKHKDVPVIMVTARDAVMDKVAGLDAGADDYLTKPIKMKLLVSRVQAILKRIDADRPPEKAPAPGLTVDRERYTVIRDGQEITLPRKEFALLDLLHSSPGKLIPREEIYAKIWGTEVVVGDRTIDVHIRKLRQKIGDERIVTVKGVGYKYEP